MKTLSPEHRANIRKSVELNWAHKHILNPPHGEANRGDVIKAVKFMVCRDCIPEEKEACGKLVQERVRHGKLIQCMQKKFKI